MADIPVFNAKDVVLTVDNVVVKGFQAGDMISYTIKEDRVQTEVDAQGFPSISINNNRLGQMTVNLSGNSPSHKFLNGLANSNKVVPIVLKSADEKISGTQAIIAKPADGQFGIQTPKRTYTIEILDMAVEAL